MSVQIARPAVSMITAFSVEIPRQRDRITTSRRPKKDTRMWNSPLPRGCGHCGESGRSHPNSARPSGARQAALKRDPHPLGFDLRFVGGYGLGADVLHEHADVLEERSYPWRRGLVSQVGGYGTRERLSRDDVKLCAMHRTGQDGSIERAHFERRVHVPTPPINRMEAPTTIANDEFAAVQLNRLHSSRRNVGGLDCLDEVITQCPSPSPTSAANCLGLLCPGARTAHTSSASWRRNARAGTEYTDKRSACRESGRAGSAGRDRRARHA